MKFDIDNELIDEISECVFNCEWVSQEEIAAYIKGCVADSDYKPEEWSVGGRGQVEIERGATIEQE